VVVSLASSCTPTKKVSQSGIHHAAGQPIHELSPLA
jgi:hypothetical protein